MRILLGEAFRISEIEFHQLPVLCSNLVAVQTFGTHGTHTKMDSTNHGFLGGSRQASAKPSVYQQAPRRVINRITTAAKWNTLRHSRGNDSGRGRVWGPRGEHDPQRVAQHADSASSVLSPSRVEIECSGAESGERASFY